MAWPSDERFGLHYQRNSLPPTNRFKSDILQGSLSQARSFGPGYGDGLRNHNEFSFPRSSSLTSDVLRDQPNQDMLTTQVYDDGRRIFENASASVPHSISYTIDSLQGSLSHTSSARLDNVTGLHNYGDVSSLPPPGSYGSNTLVGRLSQVNPSGLSNAGATEAYVPQYVVPPPRFHGGYLPSSGPDLEGYGFPVRYEVGERDRKPVIESVRFGDERTLQGAEVRGVYHPTPLIMQPTSQHGDGFEQPPLPGMIFGCTTDTYHECIRLQLFGLPATNLGLVRRVVPGSKLFLYNFRVRELSGIFEATCAGDKDLVPSAFRRWGSYPAQVRIRCIEKCPNLPITEFKQAIVENFYDRWKFNYGLSEIQVCRLMELFREEAKYWQGKNEALQRGNIIRPHLQPSFQGGHNVVSAQHHERHGKDSGTLKFQPCVNNGPLTMAGATAPSSTPCSPRWSSSPFKQEGKDALSASCSTFRVNFLIPKSPVSSGLPALEKGSESEVTSEAISGQLHNDEPIKNEQLQASDGVAVSETQVGEGSNSGAEGCKCEVEATVSSISDSIKMDGCVIPKSRKKMKTSKSRSNTISVLPLTSPVKIGNLDISPTTYKGSANEIRLQKSSTNKGRN